MLLVLYRFILMFMSRYWYSLDAVKCLCHVIGTLLFHSNVFVTLLVLSRRSPMFLSHYSYSLDSFQCLSHAVGIAPWWRHQMATFSALQAFCAGNSPVIGEFPAQRPVTRSFDVFFDLRLNKRLSEQSWGWWSETPSHSLWRHCNGLMQ